MKEATQYSTAAPRPTSDGGWSVYIVRCADNSFYTGVASDLDLRLRQHNGEIVGGARYTQGRRPVTLVWSESAKDRSEAQRREYQVRRLSRTAKRQLIAGDVASSQAE